MKEQITKTNFTCDYCEKKSGEKTDFPYEDGWCFIYNFSFKFLKEKINQFKDKHFCSKKCMKSWITNRFPSKKKEEKK